LLNVLNFVDRQVPSALRPAEQAELGVDDLEVTVPSSAMRIVFMVASPIFGFVADRQLADRRLLLACGIATWSVATGMAGFSNTLTVLTVARAFVGFGEAAFATLAMPMLADFFPPKERNRAFMIFGLGAPLGCALGFGIGSVACDLVGWRHTLVLCGFPVALTVLLVLLLEDPPVGISEPVDSTETKQGNQSRDVEQGAISASDSHDQPEAKSCIKEVMRMASNADWALATVGMVCIQFAIGGLSDWYPTYMHRYVAMREAFAGLLLSGSMFVGGIAGTILGSGVADALGNRFGIKACFLVPAVFVCLGALFCALAVNFSNRYIVMVSLLLGETFSSTYTAPVQMLSISVVAAEHRGRASSIQNVLIHVLGDMISPPLIGMISDSTNLRSGMQLTWVSLLLAALSWFCGFLRLSCNGTSSEMLPSGSFSDVMTMSTTVGSFSDVMTMSTTVAFNYRHSRSQDLSSKSVDLCDHSRLQRSRTAPVKA